MRSNLTSLSPNASMAEAEKARVGYRPMLSKKSRELRNNTGGSNSSIRSHRSRDHDRLRNNSTASPTLIKASSPIMGFKRNNRPFNDDMPINLTNQRLLNNSQESVKQNLDQSNGFNENDKSSREKTPKSQTRKSGSKESIPKSQKSDKRATIAPVISSKKNNAPEISLKKNIPSEKLDDHAKNKEERKKNLTPESPNKSNILIVDPSDPIYRPNMSSQSRNKPSMVDDQAQTLKPTQDFDDNQTQKTPAIDEGTQITPTLPNNMDTKRDIGTQFSIENGENGENGGSSVEETKSNKAEAPVHTTMIAAPNNPNDEKLVFNDEQGDGLLKSLSEVDNNFKDSEKTTENYKNSFDSRKTSMKADARNRDLTSSNSPPKTKDLFASSSDSRIEDGNLNQNTPRTNLTNTDRKKYNDIDNLALFTLKDWKDSKIFDWY